MLRQNESSKPVTPEAPFSIPVIPDMVENSWHIAPLLYLCFHAAFAVSDAGSTATNIKSENALLQHFAKAKKWQVLQICKTLSLISFAHSRVPHNLGKQREHFVLVFLILPLLCLVTLWPSGSWKSSLDSAGLFLTDLFLCSINFFKDLCTLWRTAQCASGKRWRLNRLLWMVCVEKQCLEK